MGHPFHFIHGCLPGIPHLFERGSFVPSSLREDTLPPLLYERGMGQSPRGARPLPSRLRPLAVILDCVWFASLTRSQSTPLRGFAPCPIETKSGAFRLHFPFHCVRGMGQSPRGARPLPSRLRPMAVILDCVWFASLTRSQSNPLRGFGVSLIETKTRLCSLVFVSRRERDSNPRTCDSLRISRPAQSTTLASLQGSHNLVKFLRFVYIFDFPPFISTFGLKL